MGFGGISPMQLIIILLIVLLLFGGKRLRTLGSDLGTAIKGFKKSIDDSPDSADKKPTTDQKLSADDQTLDTNQQKSKEEKF